MTDNWKDRKKRRLRREFRELTERLTAWVGPAGREEMRDRVAPQIFHEIPELRKIPDLLALDDPVDAMLILEALVLWAFMDYSFRMQLPISQRVRDRVQEMFTYPLLRDRQVYLDLRAINAKLLEQEQEKPLHYREILEF